MARYGVRSLEAAFHGSILAERSARTESTVPPNIARPSKPLVSRRIFSSVTLQSILIYGRSTVMRGNAAFPDSKAIPALSARIHNIILSLRAATLLSVQARDNNVTLPRRGSQLSPASYSALDETCGALVLCRCLSLSTN